MQPGNNYHHPQHLPHPPQRMINNMAWQQNVPNMANMPNINNYHLNQGDNTMTPYQQQHIESYTNYVPTMQSLAMPSPDMMNPNNHNVFQGYLPHNYVLQPQLSHSQLLHSPMSPVENVLISQPMSITTPPPPPHLQTPLANSSSPVHTPMINSPNNSPMVNPLSIVKKPFEKFNSRDNLVRCSKCNHENHLVVCELFNKDEEISRLHTQITKLINDLKYAHSQLEQERLSNSQSTIRILHAQQDHNLVPKLSHLSPEAPEFKPDDYSAAYASPVIDEVPVVSAKVVCTNCMLPL